MTSNLFLKTQKKHFIGSSPLTLFAYASVFFPRILDSVGFPSPINFVHFLVVPIIFGFVLLENNTRDKEKNKATNLLLAMLLVFLISLTISAVVNEAGLVNLALSYMLLAEPFFFLIIIVYLPLDWNSLTRLRNWFLLFSLINVMLAFIQYILINIGLLKVTQMTPWDNVQGVFYLSGAGHVVSSAVSMMFGLYYFASPKLALVWMRVTFLMATFIQLLVADAKQTLLTFLVAWGFLIFLKLTDIKVVFQYAISAIVVFYSLIWAINNLALFAAFNDWLNLELFEPAGRATLLKTGGIRIITSYYESPLNWLFGLGPGHTVSRLGGWMLQDYWNLLAPLGATIHPVSEAVWTTWRGHFLNSSFFSPLFSWLGIWGDTGYVGLTIYLCLWWIVWIQFCKDDFSKFIVITVMVTGFIFTQLEEPGYMITVTALIGLRWNELKLMNSSQEALS